jgi:metal-dependent amidase/aminoacylase/carboxypeptidase family protein
MSCLIGAALLFLRVRDRIPSNHCIRLLFQPAEEGPGGALPMIKAGCLDGVDEVYGSSSLPLPFNSKSD